MKTTSLFNRLLSTGLIALLAFLFTEKSHAQRYLAPCFDSIQVWRAVSYSRDAPKFAGTLMGKELIQNQDLKMDIFMPPTSDTLKRRPVVILAHGGGFVDLPLMRETRLVGTRHNEDIQALADSLARRGFVTASISYRLGFNPLTKRSYARALWRGAQDMSAAIRFFRQNADALQIDPEAVFAGGSSAGAMCALHSCFLEYEERLLSSKGLRPGLKDLGPLHSRPILQINANDYYSAKEVQGGQVDSLPQAIVAYWGSLSDTAYLRGAHRAPMLLFHGNADAIVPVQTGRALSGFSNTAPILHGGASIDDHSKKLGIPSELHIANGEGHEYWGAVNGDWIRSGPTHYWSDIVRQTAAFFVKYLP